MELIEHLYLDTVDSFTDTVLGVIKPKLWVVTTPNKDYNELFPDWPGNKLLGVPIKLTDSLISGYVRFYWDSLYSLTDSYYKGTFIWDLL